MTLALALGYSQVHSGGLERGVVTPLSPSAGEQGVDASADPTYGDSAVFAVAPPREPASPEQWSDVLPRLQEAASSEQATAADKRRLGIALYALGRYEETEALYRGLLDQEEDAVVRNRLGNVLRDKGDLAGAEEAYRRSIAQDPALPAAYVNLAELLWRQHRDDEALGVLDAAENSIPEAALPAIARTREAMTQTAGTTSVP
jgi:tetratricopeptide (TPR) repeat protein